jgi:RecA-family ATPase
MGSLDYYASIGAALFPIPAGQKAPGSKEFWEVDGRAGSFKHHCSNDPAQWERWQAERQGCNFGVVAFASGLIIVDIDTSGEVGRDEAWQAWCDLCASWKLSDPIAPHVESANGGWHCYMKLPPHVDPSTLRQPDALKGRINIRCIGYTVAAGSHFEGRPYRLFPDAPPPYPAPQALLDHCSPVERTTTQSLPGNLDKGDVADLLDWLSERDGFDAYEDWLSCGMSLKLAFGDDGLDLWARTHNETVTPDVIATKWDSFASERRGNSVTLNSFFDRAHKLGWKGSVRPSVASMFGGVAQLAAAAGEPGMPAVESPPMAPAYPLPQERSTAPGVSNELRSRRISAATLKGKTAPDREWLVRDLIPARNVTLLFGDGGTGKSLWAMQLGAAVVTGKLIFGHLVQQGRVEFISAEDSQDELHRRLIDIARENTTTLDELAGLHLTSLAEADALLAVAEDNRGGTLVATPLYYELESMIAESRPKLVVLDTLADVFGGNEIIRSQARQFIGMLRRLCLQYDCTIVVLAHPSLSGMDRGTSGSTAWSNSVRSRLLFRRVHEKDGREADEDARILEVCKSNYGRVGLQIPMKWRAGAFVSAGCGGDPMVTAAKADQVFLELLEKARSQNIEVHFKTGRGYAPGEFKADASKQGVSKGELAAAMKRLLDDGKIVNAPFGPPSRTRHRLQLVGSA